MALHAYKSFSVFVWATDIAGELLAKGHEQDTVVQSLLPQEECRTQTQRAAPSLKRQGNGY